MPYPKINIPLFYLLFFAGAFMLSVLINSIFLSFSTNLGIRKNHNVQIRWNSSAKPALGGISFYVIFLISLAFLGISKIVNPSNIVDAKSIGILISVTIAFVMGLADDAFDTKPLLKFTTQFFCALILILTDNRIFCFDSEFLNILLSVLWVIGLMNSINMLDNMDAITTIVSIIILGLICIIPIQFNQPLNYVSILALGILGALCGFLLYNWHPSKLFMGDAGSQFLGLFLAIVGFDNLWNFKIYEFQSNMASYFPGLNLLLIISVFIIPISDTLIVVINRIREGRSPFIGGKDHTTHFLFRKGFSERKIAILFMLITFLSCILVFFVMKVFPLNLFIHLFMGLYSLAIFLSLFLVTKIKNK